MPNYLEFFPRPLLVDLCENQVLPFIGSGFSLNAITPPGRRMPLITQIAACLNELMPEFQGQSPMDIISEFDIRFGRAQWAEELYKMLLVGVAEPGPAHLAFARLPFDTVATTNVDQLLEEAYFRVDRFPQVIMFDDQLPVKDTADDPVALLKIHGDVNFPDRLIWTEEDYDTFLARYPLQATYLACLLITHTPLFIGYSVDDYDFRQIWNIIGDRLGNLRRRAYAIEVAATPSMIARYQRRGVEVINLPGSRENFGQILADTFRQLRQFLREGCPPAGIPPCEALGVPLDIGTANGNDDSDSSDSRSDHDHDSTGMDETDDDLTTGSTDDDETDDCTDDDDTDDDESDGRNRRRNDRNHHNDRNDRNDRKDRKDRNDRNDRNHRNDCTDRNHRNRNRQDNDRSRNHNRRRCCWRTDRKA